MFIQWVGEKVKPMVKAKLATHKGALSEKCGVSIQCNTYNINYVCILYVLICLICHLLFGGSALISVLKILV